MPTHLYLFNYLLKDICRRTPHRIRYDDDDKKTRIQCRRLDYHRCDAHIVLPVPPSELADEVVPVHEQPSCDEPRRGQVEHERGDAVREGVHGGRCAMEVEMDEDTAGDWRTGSGGG